MKKFIYQLMVITICALVGVYYSCNNTESNEMETNKADTADKLLLTKNQVELLNREFPFLDYKQCVNVRNDIHLINTMKKDLSESDYSKLISNFDLSKVTVMEWDDYFSYTLASMDIEGEYYTIILSKNNSKTKQFDKESFLLNIDATADGTGTLKETSKYGISTAVF
ncbi:MAG: hypothetical protein LBN18_08575, partial [Dysgonamonadaceae bacterium]|nr:hypothetical protein [Dysgonamonadaceae bacterium]